MILLCYGPPKTASSAAFTLARSLVRKSINLNGGKIIENQEFGKFYGDGLYLSKDLKDSIIKILKHPLLDEPHNALFIKTHYRPSVECSKAVEDGRIKLLISHRHPADQALALVDSSRKINPDNIKTIDDIAKRISDVDNTFSLWSKCKPNFVIDYNALALKPHALAVSINDFLDLNLPIQQVHDEVNILESDKLSYGKYNKGVVDRRKQEMDSSDIDLFERLAPSLTRSYYLFRGDS